VDLFVSSASETPPGEVARCDWLDVLGETALWTALLLVEDGETVRWLMFGGDIALSLFGGEIAR
jgi:hypothetical protein